MAGMDTDTRDNPTYRVLADYEVNDPHPLVLEANQEVEVVRNDSSWPGWVWIRAGEQVGWIPETFLSGQSGPDCRTSRAFNGRDLSARRGEILTVRESASGWILAVNEGGQSGWFPLFNLRPVQ